VKPAVHLALVVRIVGGHEALLYPLEELMYLTQASDLAANATTIIALRIPHWILVSRIFLSFREV
jgi:hypothetical protein